MKVVVPYTNLRDETVRALELWGPSRVEYHDVSSSDEEYFNVLARTWAQGEGFILIEHDIEIGPETICTLTQCGHDWCAFPYAMGGSGYKSALGCTKFSDDVVQTLSSLMAWVSDVRDPWAPPRHWARNDIRIAEFLRQNGYEEFVHWPPVKHHNPEKRVPLELELDL